MRVVGVDGCRGGWLAIIYDREARMLIPRVHRSFADLLATHADAVSIGVDIPIGLSAGEPRRCDLEARRLLGPRRSSVFPAPDPRIVNATTYQEALARSRALTGKGISAQSFGIYAKVAEVNSVMTPQLQDRVFESHPEAAFWALAGGRPMAHSKKTPEGFAERRALLLTALDGVDIPHREQARHLARPAAPDDVLDAIAVAWTARRHAEGKARRLPADCPRDARRLRMEIVY